MELEERVAQVQAVMGPALDALRRAAAVAPVNEKPAWWDDLFVRVPQPSRFFPELLFAMLARERGDLGARLEAGMTSLNDFNATYMCQSLPFGGVKHSGFGRFGGVEGLRALCVPKVCGVLLFVCLFFVFCFGARGCAGRAGERLGGSPMTLHCPPPLLLPPLPSHPHQRTPLDPQKQIVVIDYHW